LSNIKSLIAKQLTVNSYVEAEDLRAIILGAAARYEALDVKFLTLDLLLGNEREILYDLCHLAQEYT
ncbi:Hypothetical protein FKW44_001443, partial [Caligus rogercresseyi]